MNKVFLIGRLTDDPRFNQLSDKMSVARVTIAVEREKSTTPQTDYLPLVCWNNTATFITKYVPKGTLVAIDGWITTGSYTKGNNQTVYTTDITVDNIKILEPRSVIEARLQKVGREYTQSFKSTNVDPNPSFKKDYDYNELTADSLSDEFDNIQLDTDDLN
ncbi:single strand binding protein [Mycoplasmopsis californica]|uniref:Single-stranded DNA-binding protein n=1 Tax=Mycoplasmopsis equigenitalium TaxID=114883 RepID=A0ABY5J0R3_9BACT|nr:single-stranded DNA-binding protein [Mycoplasmopsis equigenitalium]UUD36845.1 single-stranded DNA-binding protein [Mycoplasmopsis equigenitalium]VEU69859.1 single strand binding protein [Mycoplasmopsis californica]